eukprot:COSAG03_NODE_12756_length_532_cov_1.655889_1_plen_50_part_01
MCAIACLQATCCALVGAYLFAYTTGDNTGIQRLHVGPYTCAAGKELALVR